MLYISPHIAPYPYYVLAKGICSLHTYLLHAHEVVWMASWVVMFRSSDHEIISRSMVQPIVAI